MRFIIATALLLLAANAQSAFAQPPCKASNKTASFLDQILTADTIADIKADKAVRKEAFHNIVEILNGDECVKFVLGKGKTKKLAAKILTEKQASARKKSSAVIGKFLASQ